MKTILHSSFVRFCLVGVANTAIDVGLFTALRVAHVDLVLANICSTTVALAFSLLVNYRFTFKAKAMTKKTIVQYIVVTLVGLWIMQPICIKALMIASAQTHATKALIAAVGHADAVNNAIPKLASIVVTLVWNYTWYSRVIFKGEPKNVIEAESVEAL